MKKYLTAGFLAGLLAGIAVLGLPPILAAEDSTESLPSSTTTTFEVEGMTCGGCEVGVRLNVKKLDGVETVEVSYEDGQAKVTYDAEKVTPEEIQAAIEQLGYSAEVQEPEEETKEPSDG